MHNFIFGVFNNGKLVFQIGLTTKCTHYQAHIIVGLLGMAKCSLTQGDYFAYDYKEVHK